jgi:hypothetical protein
MTETTERLALPLLAASQSQKHVTHNEALVALDALVQLAVIDRQSVPPEAPDEADRYIVSGPASGAWSGQDDTVAVYQDGAWQFLQPHAGWVAWAAAMEASLVFDGTAWSDLKPRQADTFGVSATADADNRLAVSSPAVLFNHAGSGSQIKVNKQAAGDTASLLFQTNWSGRAELGLAGDDDWHVKVSEDGAAWRDALIAERAGGAVRFPNGIRHGVTGAPLTGFIITPGGDGQVSLYRNDILRSQHPRSAAIASIAGDTITLTTPDADLFFHSFMQGVSLARIWNTTKTPNQSSWIVAKPSTSRLQVHASADISGWSSGDIIQIGDPTAFTPGRVIALDISPMLQNVLGGVFRQSAVLCKAGLKASTIAADLSLSPTGGAGTFVTGAKNADMANIWPGLALVPCTELSPISNSNLVMLRETSPDTFSTTVISSLGVFA